MLIQVRSAVAPLCLLWAAASPALAQTGPAVPGFTRFYAEAKPDAAGGRLLLNELHCTRCHAPADAKPDKPAPILDGVGSRIKPAYLKEFLNDPQHMKPGTKMPNLFAGLDPQDKQAMIEALVHFLAATGVPAQIHPDKKTVATGRDLFHKVGCVACHGPRDAKGDQEKVFATSVPLGNLKAKYTLASLKTFLENPHQTRPNGRMPGLLNAKESIEVANYLMQGTIPTAVAENMTYAYYELSDPQKLPDFTKVKPKTTGTAADFDLGVARRTNDVALKFEGHLKIDKNGTYTFHLTSDDGSKLWIGDKVIVDNDGIHPPQSKSGKTKLTKGMHKIVVGVFNSGAGFELGVEFEGPTVARQPIAPWIYLTEKAETPTAPQKKAPDAFVARPELVAQGKELFASVGCANCHQMQKETTRLSAPALANLKADGGCLDTTPKKGTAWYGLSAAQRAALKEAILHPRPAPSSVKESIVQTMQALNCYACHERDKIGGVEEGANKYFEATFKEWGDEARMPPGLTGVGAKLNSAYLKKILEQGAHDRPYMHTRMPKFGAPAGGLVALYESADAAEKGPAIVFSEAPTKIKSAGRHMVGKDAFGCINCHNFGGVKTEGVQGIDMAIMTERLKKDWYHNYMLNPTKYRAGTRMPTSFPDGTTPLTKILDGKADTQIEAIWVYLSDGKSATAPIGMSKSSIPLMPTTEAIIYRNFIQGAGTRAIGVGYPEKANLAFDANDIRLAMIWQGAFIDARRHWTGRGEGFEPPMGDNVLKLPDGATFATLSQPDEPWPTGNPKQQGYQSAKEQGYKFLGYRLSDDERPTFLYSYKNVRIEDFPNAVETKGHPSIVRTYTLTADNNSEKLYLRAAVGDKIQADKDGWYRINDWRMRIVSDATPEIRRVGNKMELVVPVQFKGKTAKIVQEYQW
jgi:cytochrome c553